MIELLYNNNKCIMDFIYLMSGKFVCDVRFQTNFHGVKYIKPIIHLYRLTTIINVPTLSGLSISILIETRGISRMATAGLINGHIRNKCKSYMR